MAGLGLMNRRRGIQTFPTQSDSIKFADPAVLAVLIANGVSSNGVSITAEDAARVTSLSTWFQNNTEIVTFDELQFFTGITDNNATFQGCANLESVVWPPSLNTFYSSGIKGTKMELRVVIPYGVTSIARYSFNNMTTQFIDVPATCTTVVAAFYNAQQLKTLIMRPETPPRYDSTLVSAYRLTGIYVPDASVDAYKAASGWTGYSSKIFPLSQYTE